MNLKASFGNRFRSKLQGIKPPLCGIVQLANSAALRFRNWSFNNKSNSTLYTGVTNDLKRRVFEHKNKLVEGFTKKYNIDKLVFYEIYNDINNAIAREKQITGITPSALRDCSQ